MIFVLVYFEGGGTFVRAAVDSKSYWQTLEKYTNEIVLNSKRKKIPGVISLLFVITK